MNISMKCPACDNDLKVSVDNGNIQAAIRENKDIQIIGEPPESQNKEIEELKKKAEKFAKNYSDDGDVDFDVMPSREMKEILSYKIGERFCEYGFVVEQLKKRKMSGNRILDVGSAHTVLPAILLALGNVVVSLDAQKWVMKYPNFRVLVCDILNSERKLGVEEYDIVVCVSTIEHIGLGRWGDSESVEGDFLAMEIIKRTLKYKGMLFLSLPVGVGRVLYPAHRVYNEKRLEKLIRGFSVLEERYFMVDDTNTYFDLCDKKSAFSETRPYAIGCLSLRKGVA